MNLNSLNILLYSNSGKNLYSQSPNASEEDISSHLLLFSIYFMSAHSNIGVRRKYIIKNITQTMAHSII